MDPVESHRAFRTVHSGTVEYLPVTLPSTSVPGRMVILVILDMFFSAPAMSRFLNSMVTGSFILFSTFWAHTGAVTAKPVAIATIKIIILFFISHPFMT